MAIIENLELIESILKAQKQGEAPAGFMNNLQMFNRTAKSTQRLGTYNLYDSRLMSSHMMLRHTSVDNQGFNNTSYYSS